MLGLAVRARLAPCGDGMSAPPLPEGMRVVHRSRVTLRVNTDGLRAALHSILRDRKKPRARLSRLRTLLRNPMRYCTTTEVKP